MVQMGVGFLGQCGLVSETGVLGLDFYCMGLLCVLVGEMVKVILVVGSSVGVGVAVV